MRLCLGSKIIQSCKHMYNTCIYTVHVIAVFFSELYQVLLGVSCIALLCYLVYHLHVLVDVYTCM